MSRLRTRRRHRGEPISFRALFAAVAREAAFQIIWGDVNVSELRWRRDRFTYLEARYVRRQAVQTLQRYPGRRITR